MLEGSGGRQSGPGGWSLSPQVDPARRPGAGDFGWAWVPATRTYPKPGQDFQEMHIPGPRGGVRGGAGPGRGEGFGGGGGTLRGGAGAGPGPLKRSAARSRRGRSLE